MLRPIYEIKQSKIFMESLIADFVQSSCAYAKFLYLEWTLGTMSTLSFEIFIKFPHFLRS